MPQNQSNQIDRYGVTSMYDFVIEIDGNARDVVDLARELIESEGGRFTSDDSLAVFSIPTPLGRVEGKCELSTPSKIGVVITQKPMLVSKGIIKSKMNAALEKITQNGAG